MFFTGVWCGKLCCFIVVFTKFIFVLFLLQPSTTYSWGVLFMVYFMKLEFSTSNFVLKLL